MPDLGYFRTDRPHPRGELLVKSEGLFPGYYKRPELTAEMFDDDGYYRTGDIVAETGPDQLVYLDRRNNVLKLSQGEFVTVSKLEAAFGDSPLGAADLRLRQQRPLLPAGGGRADRRRTGALRRGRAQKRYRRIAFRCREGSGTAVLRDPARRSDRDDPVHTRERIC